MAASRNKGLLGGKASRGTACLSRGCSNSETCLDGVSTWESSSHGDVWLAATGMSLLKSRNQWNNAASGTSANVVESFLLSEEIMRGAMLLVLFEQLRIETVTD